MKVMELYFYDKEFVVVFNKRTASTEDVKLLMRWMIHNLNIRLGDAKTLTDIAVADIGNPVVIAKFEDLDAGVALLRKLEPKEETV
jgi:hypothetical protein